MNIRKLTSRRRHDPKTRARVSLTIGTILVIACLLALGEVVLRKTGKFRDYYERHGQVGRMRRTERLPEPWLWVHLPNQVQTQANMEFTQSFRFNSEGLPGELPPLQKVKNELRIAIVGDSFTQGVGDLEGLGYVGRLERILRKRSRNYTIVNGGCEGSDPVFQLELLERRLLKYQPDLVLLTFNTTDLVDFERRGGFERFTPNGALIDQRPYWAPLFSASHLVRALALDWFHLDWDLRSPAEQRRVFQHSRDTAVEVGKRASALAAAHGFRFFYVVHPTKREVQEPNPQLSTVVQDLREAGIGLLDLRPGFAARRPGGLDSSDYWLRDGHYTSKGYEVFSLALLEELDRNGLLNRARR